MSWKDQARRRHAAEKRGRRGTRRAGAMLLRQIVLHPVAGAAADDEPATEAVLDEQEVQPRIKSGATDDHGIDHEGQGAVLWREPKL